MEAGFDAIKILTWLRWKNKSYVAIMGFEFEL
jgi:hypothetical protein